MPVGTAATVKAMTVDQVKDTGADIILGNTYHLMLRPTAERVKRLGGLHKFMRWDKPILTDSGGFQVMSLSGISKVTEEAVTFSSHIDGSKHVLSPERSIEIQADLLGSDIVMQLDECVAWPAEEARARKGMELSARWGQRSKDAFGTRDSQVLFGIQQGSTFENLRRESSDRLRRSASTATPSAGWPWARGTRRCARCWTTRPAMLPADRPRYLMGVGKPIDLVEAVARRRHVRLRAAHPLGPPRPGLDLGRGDQHEERPLRRGRGPAGPDQRLPGQPRLFEGLSAPPVQGRGDPGPGAAVLAQHRLLPGPDGGHARAAIAEGPVRGVPPRPFAAARQGSGIMSWAVLAIAPKAAWPAALRPRSIRSSFSAGGLRSMSSPSALSSGPTRPIRVSQSALAGRR
jgi:hypothetical protein